MLFKKKCKKCEEKVEKNFDFCPYCGNPLNKKDYGLLGTNDNINDLEKNFFGSTPMGGFSNSMFEKILGGAFKMLEKEMQKVNEEEMKIRKLESPRANLQLFINGKPVNIGEFQQKIHNSKQDKIPVKEIPKISEEVIKRSSKLPRKEAQTKLTRHKEKIIYELETPGLKDINNILINKLENSFEIKAYTDKVVYFKVLPNLPLLRYGLGEEKVFLEFKTS